jgi:tRNA uridine 5-carboxymethylaminomethyl modification enzyme
LQTFHAGDYDVAVIGAGHAGVEAGLAAARLGMKTLMLTINLDGLALMACNPAVGGTSKGHLVRELDALGGEMALCTDATCIQTRLLNTSKGPAVQSLRAQMDKRAYQRRMKWTVENTGNLSLKQGECVRILTRGGRVAGVVTAAGARYGCRAVVLATGVYLKGRVIIGEYTAFSGPSGLFPAEKLSGSLRRLGLRLMRFKTGTPARVDGRSLDFTRMEEQPGDPCAPPFSFMTDRVDCPQIPCWLTYTGRETHRIIRENLHRSPLFSGAIEGTGPRYCPSIEDKVVRFAEKAAHQVFIEPEGLDTREMYVQGMSTSLPVDVQIAMLRTLPGLERMELMRPGYAIEYDCLDPTQVSASLMIKEAEGLFAAGQINGTSGYEEAAAQGVVAGVNAAQYLKGLPPLVLDRAQAYIGVLIDDLVTKGTNEPYRMMTSRAEHRLVLRQDNADLRLTEIGRRIGLVGEERYTRMMRKREQTEKLVKHFQETYLRPSPALLKAVGEGGGQPPAAPARIADLLKRPRLRYASLAPFDESCPEAGPDAVEQAEIAIKYEGYIAREAREVERFRKMESRALPKDINYDAIAGLRKEARQKLNALRPESVGQAGRVSGVSPADIAVLLVYLEKYFRTNRHASAHNPHPPTPSPKGSGEGK